MGPGPRSNLNIALIGAVLFSAFCWICLYAAFADFAEAGFALMTRPGLAHSVGGAVMVVLHGLGLLLLFVLAGGAVAALVRIPNQHNGHDRHVNGSAH